MPDIITAVTVAISTGKQLLTLPGIAKNAEAKLLIAELQVQLAEVSTSPAR